jgi:hypothetical protein
MPMICPESATNWREWIGSQFPAASAENGGQEDPPVHFDVADQGRWGACLETVI